MLGGGVIFSCRSSHSQHPSGSIFAPLFSFVVSFWRKGKKIAPDGWLSTNINLDTRRKICLFIFLSWTWDKKQTGGLTPRLFICLFLPHHSSIYLLSTVCFFFFRSFSITSFFFFFYLFHLDFGLFLYLSIYLSISIYSLSIFICWLLIDLFFTVSFYFIFFTLFNYLFSFNLFISIFVYLPIFHCFFFPLVFHTFRLRLILSFLSIDVSECIIYLSIYLSLFFYLSNSVFWSIHQSIIVSISIYLSILASALSIYLC